MHSTTKKKEIEKFSTFVLGGTFLFRLKVPTYYCYACFEVLGSDILYFWVFFYYYNCYRCCFMWVINGNFLIRRLRKEGDKLKKKKKGKKKSWWIIIRSPGEIWMKEVINFFCFVHFAQIPNIPPPRPSSDSPKALYSKYQ